MLAKSIAGEAKVPFFSIRAPIFVEMFVGVALPRARHVRERQEERPCIIFIDEIDAVGASVARAWAAETMSASRR